MTNVLDVSGVPTLAEYRKMRLAKRQREARKLQADARRVIAAVKRHLKSFALGPLELDGGGWKASNAAVALANEALKPLGWAVRWERDPPSSDGRWEVEILGMSAAGLDWFDKYDSVERPKPSTVRGEDR